MSGPGGSVTLHGRRPFRRLESRYLVLPEDNVDTDRIIPARFLKGTGRSGLAAGLFADRRYGPDGSERTDFVLNRPEAREAQVLVAGDNFGCGSSREHAAWALAEFGFRAVVSTRLADIFAANAIKNGLLPVVVDHELHGKLLGNPFGRVVIDLGQQTLTLEDGTVGEFPIDPFAKHCLLNGVDELGFLLQQSEAIAAYEARWGKTGP